jgi:signal transduction histidine kinase
MAGMRWSMLGFVRRTSWLMVGAAIGLAAVALAVALAQVTAPLLPGPDWPWLTLLLLAIPLLGLLPGIRELEVTAARSLLDARASLVLPDRPRLEHRVRTVAWVGVHLGGGLAVAVLVFGVLPGAVATLGAALTGTPLEVGGAVLPTGSSGTRVLVGAAAVLAAVLALLGCVAAGRAAGRLVPRFLGPTWRDQWELAEARLATEAAHTRLARDLHDGIGHALTIISVQATAARRAGDREATERGLQVIEATARDALGELDGVLGLLRDGEVAQRRPDPTLRDLPAVFGPHRQAGMRLMTPSDGDLAALDAGLPEAVSRVAYRVVAEGLTNAERYAAPGPVEVRVDTDHGRLEIGVASVIGPGQRSGRRGHGLEVLDEQLRILGGTSTAGPDPDGRWWLRARLPLGTLRGGRRG